MKTKIILSVLVFIGSSFSEIYSNEIVLRIGEVVDLDSGCIKIATIDTSFDSSSASCPDDNWFSTEQSLCRCSKKKQFDLGFFYNGTIIDCFGAPPEFNCTEAMKSIFSAMCIYEFKQNDFYNDLDNPIDTSDTSTFFKYYLDDASFWDESGNAVDCSISHGPDISDFEEERFFCKYYLIITEQRNECLFTILKRDTVQEYCEFNGYNAIRIRYYLKTDERSQFLSIANEIRDRIVSQIKMNRTHFILKNEDYKRRKPCRYDLSGRIHTNIYGTTLMSIYQMPSQRYCKVLTIK